MGWLNLNFLINFCWRPRQYWVKLLSANEYGFWPTCSAVSIEGSWLECIWRGHTKYFNIYKRYRFFQDTICLFAWSVTLENTINYSKDEDKIGNRYNQVPHLTQDKYTTTSHTGEPKRQSLPSRWPQDCMTHTRQYANDKHKIKKRSTKEVPP